MEIKITDLVKGGKATARKAKLSELNVDINSIKPEGVDINSSGEDLDVVLVEGWLVSKLEKRNLNAVGYKLEDIKKLEKEGKLLKNQYAGIIDYSHDFTPRGVWYNAEVRENKEAGGEGLYAWGVIWAWLDPDFANWVLGASERGELYFSTAVATKYYECSICGTTVEDKNDFEHMCEHMKLSLANIGVENDNLAIIYMREPIIVGASVTVYPADTDAEATNTEREILMHWSDNNSKEDKSMSEGNEKIKENAIDENKEYVALKKNVSYLKKLPIDYKSGWSFEAKDGNAIIDKYGFETYTKVHLAKDPDANPETKGAYHFPVAKIKGGQLTLFRRGVIAAKQRAAQNGHPNIVALADSLLSYIDKKQNNEVNNNEEDLDMEKLDAILEAINSLKETIEQYVENVNTVIEKFNQEVEEKDKEINEVKEEKDKIETEKSEEVEKVKNELREVLINSIVEKSDGAVKKEDLEELDIDALKAMNEKILPNIKNAMEMNSAKRVGGNKEEKKNPFLID